MSDTLHIVGKPYSPYRAFLGIFVPLPLLKFDGLSEGAKLLFGRLTMYAGKSGKCFPSLESLTAEFFTNPNQSTTTIKRWMGELVKQGFIKRTRRGPGKNAECVFLWHRALEAKSVGIGEEMPDPGSPEIPASKVAEMRPQQQADEPSLDRPKWSIKRMLRWTKNGPLMDQKWYLLTDQKWSMPIRNK